MSFFPHLLLDRSSSGFVQSVCLCVCIFSIFAETGSFTTETVVETGEDYYKMVSSSNSHTAATHGNSSQVSDACVLALQCAKMKCPHQPSLKYF